MFGNLVFVFFLFVSSLPPPLLSEEKLRNQSKIHQDSPAHKPLSQPPSTQTPTPLPLFFVLQASGNWMRCSFSGQLVWGRYELRFPTPGKVKPPRLDGVHRPIEWRFSPFTNHQWRGSRGGERRARDSVWKREKNGGTSDINSLFLITQLGQEWLGVIAGMGEERWEYYRLSGLCLCDRGDEHPSFTNAGSAFSLAAQNFDRQCEELTLALKHPNENQMKLPP